jgi:hypothetical protein
MSEWIMSNTYAYPALEVVHIVGIALLVGNLVLLELRVWGRGSALPVKPLAALALRISVVGFVLAVCSGLLMMAGQFDELLGKNVFAVKLTLIALAGCNAALFHNRGGVERLDGTARGLTALSLLLWLAVIICGRWIGYS